MTATITAAELAEINADVTRADMFVLKMNVGMAHSVCASKEARSEFDAEYEYWRALGAASKQEIKRRMGLVDAPAAPAQQAAPAPIVAQPEQQQKQQDAPAQDSAPATPPADDAAARIAELEAALAAATAERDELKRLFTHVALTNKELQAKLSSAVILPQMDAPAWHDMVVTHQLHLIPYVYAVNAADIISRRAVLEGAQQELTWALARCIAALKELDSEAINAR